MIKTHSSFSYNLLYSQWSHIIRALSISSISFSSFTDDILKERFQEVLKEHQIENDHLSVSCRSLTPEEAIGKTKRTDYPILTGKDVMIQAEYKGFRGQAFTDAPSSFEGMLEDILQMDIEHDPHDRGIFKI